MVSSISGRGIRPLMIAIRRIIPAIRAPRQHRGQQALALYAPLSTLRMIELMQQQVPPPGVVIIAWSARTRRSACSHLGASGDGKIAFYLILGITGQKAMTVERRER